MDDRDGQGDDAPRKVVGFEVSASQAQDPQERDAASPRHSDDGPAPGPGPTPEEPAVASESAGAPPVSGDSDAYDAIGGDEGRARAASGGGGFASSETSAPPPPPAATTDGGVAADAAAEAAGPAMIRTTPAIPAEAAVDGSDDPSSPEEQLITRKSRTPVMIMPLPETMTMSPVHGRKSRTIDALLTDAEGAIPTMNQTRHMQQQQQHETPHDPIMDAGRPASPSPSAQRAVAPTSGTQPPQPQPAAHTPAPAQPPVAQAPPQTPGQNGTALKDDAPIPAPAPANQAAMAAVPSASPSPSIAAAGPSDQPPPAEQAPPSKGKASGGGGGGGGGGGEEGRGRVFLHFCVFRGPVAVFSWGHPVGPGEQGRRSQK